MLVDVQQKHAADRAVWTLQLKEAKRGMQALRAEMERLRGKNAKRAEYKKKLTKLTKLVANLEKKLAEALGHEKKAKDLEKQAKDLEKQASAAANALGTKDDELRNTKLRANTFQQRLVLSEQQHKAEAAGHVSVLKGKELHVQELKAQHALELRERELEAGNIEIKHNSKLLERDGKIEKLKDELQKKELEIQTLKAQHASELLKRDSKIEKLLAKIDLFKSTEHPAATLFNFLWALFAKL